MERPDLRPPVRGIDPDLAWDEDGECYLTWEGTVSGGQSDGIFQGRLDMKTGEFDGEPYPVWQGIGLAASEAPHLYRIGEHWYLILAEGGTERGHTDTIARADRPEEPVRVVPGQSRVLSPQPRPSGPEHRPSLVQTASGEWAAVYLAVRPGGFTPSFHVLGRETFLAGVDWVDGWPVFDEGRYEFTPTDTAFEDDFASAVLHLPWVTANLDPARSAASVLRRASAGPADRTRHESVALTAAAVSRSSGRPRPGIGRG